MSRISIPLLVDKPWVALLPEGDFRLDEGAANSCFVTDRNNTSSSHCFPAAASKIRAENKAFKRFSNQNEAHLPPTWRRSRATISCSAASDRTSFEVAETLSAWRRFQSLVAVRHGKRHQSPGAMHSTPPIASVFVLSESEWRNWRWQERL